MIKPSYVITVEVNGASTSSIWNSEKPLQIGHPFRWVAEKTDGGIRVRNVTSENDAESCEVTDGALEKGASIDLPESEKAKSGFVLAIRPVISLPPAIKTHGDGTGELRAYSMRGDWNVGASTLENQYTGYVLGKRAFEIRRAGENKYKIKSFNDQIQLDDVSLGKGGNITLTQEELEGTNLSSGEFKWRFASLKRVGANPVPISTAKMDEETNRFRRSFGTACAMIAMFLLFALVWPKPEMDPKPQMTQMVFKKPVQYATAAAMGHASDVSFGTTPMKHARGSSQKKIHVAKVVHKAPGHHTAKAVAHAKPAHSKAHAKSVAKAAPKSVAKHAPKAVAHAKTPAVKSALTSKIIAKGPVHTPVRAAHEERDTQLAKTLSDPSFMNASHGTVKGGMTKLLADKGYANGSDAKAEAKGMFKSGSHGSSFGGADQLGSRSVVVASLGGDGGLFSGNGGVGYGKGSHASVSGQGKNFVSLDTGKSDVEEGLTKEQVGKVIHAHMSEIRYCYESAQLRDPDLAGKLSVAFVVGAPGNVSSAKLAQANSAEHALGECLVGRLKSWQFPHPLGGVNVAVNYPFIFKVLGR
jgi:hypothetical protein